MAPKRKLDTTGDDAPRVKKSPLAGLPQNYYAPPRPMTQDELFAWRKEQRRERNRQSAAESRNKTKARIQELEGEVQKYKTECEMMQERMAMMERQIQLLTEMAKKNGNTRADSPVEQPTVTPPGSHPNSPSRSTHVSAVGAALPDISSSHLSFFPPLLSTLADCASAQLKSQTFGTTTDNASPSRIATKEHLIKPISRQA
jgi:hypothetical protein